MIIQNGFLAALAFAIESVNDPEFEIDTESGYYRKKEDQDSFKGCGYANTFLSVMKDLKETKKDNGICGGTLKDFLKGLCNQDQVLRMVTDEAIQYLNYLRRFAKSDK
jgi:CRISPR type III-B/RAMP module-associated protein Cmr5